MKTQITTVCFILTISFYVESAIVDIACIPGTFICNDAGTDYFVCPTDGKLLATANPVKCPGTDRCFANVISGKKDDGTSNGPCLPAPCTTAGLFPASFNGQNIDACAGYYECNPTTSPVTITVENCRPGSHFNNQRKSCDTIANAGCDPFFTTTTTATTPTTTTPTTTTPTTTTPTTTTPTTTTPTTTTRTTTTPAPTTPAPTTSVPTSPSTAAPTTTTTSLPTTTSTSTTTTFSPPVCNGLGRFVDPRSCRFFYKCGLLNQRGRRMRCPFRLRYDVLSQRCTRNADCGSRPL